MKKLVFALLFLISVGIASAQTIDTPPLRPPLPNAEQPGPLPRAGVVWISGYHRWNSGSYVWIPGHYEVPPRPRAVWVPHRWMHRHGQWILVEGYWR
jgi:hypothetical protein